MTLRTVKGFRDVFVSLIEKPDSGDQNVAPVPCVEGCPAKVNIPGYIALVAAGRYTDAIRLVRNDNPFAIACGLICEHPCELYCRRGMVDDPLNIRGIKRFAADHQVEDYTPEKEAASGKCIAIIGGGPSGLSAAYFLALMGHSPTVYEQRAQLGGMLRYGIPAYRFPREDLDKEINWMVDLGIDVKLNTSVGTDIHFSDLRAQYDAVYLAIGDHAENKLGIEGEDAEGVLSAVELLRAMGDDKEPDFSGKIVAVIGGGNVAMDCARSALRLGAKKVVVAYRRRKLDMPAQQAEIEAAIAEGCELLELHAPLKIETSEGGVSGLVLKPQIISTIEGGRAKPKDSESSPVTISCDIVLSAIGQKLDTSAFAFEGITIERGKVLTDPTTSIDGQEGLFAGGDCVSGPASAVRAVAAGKAAAYSIDEYLGFNHHIKNEVEIPTALFGGRVYCARSNMVEPHLDSIAGNFEQVETGLLPEEALQEASRCLRCDHFGLGAFRERRTLKW